MKSKTRSVQQIIEEQVRKWQILSAEKQAEPEGVSVITVSREPGSGGSLVAKGIAAKLAMDFFHQEVIHEMAESAQISTKLVETLDEKGLSVIEDWIASLVDDRHLWPDQYMQHLMKIIGTIGKHGRAVMVGRGANFLIPRERRFRVRVIAPRAMRIQNLTRDFGVSADEAKRRIIRTESDRRAFIRKYFHADIADPVNYDLVINMERMDVDAAVDIVKKAVKE